MITTTHLIPDPAAAADPATSTDADLARLVRKAVAKRSFAVLATASDDGRSHAAGVLYAVAEGNLWISTLRSSRKAKNVAGNPRVAITIPVRRLPVGPPSSVQLQAKAEVVDVDDAELRRLAASGALKKVTSHGELELADGCFLRVALPERVPVYGLGMSLWRLMRDPLAAGRVARVVWR
jgi:hypothetical protein